MSTSMKIGILGFSQHVQAAPKECLGCGGTKPRSEFHSNGGGTLRPRCKACEKDRYQRKHQARGGAARANMKEYYSQNHSKWRQAILARQSMTPEDYDAVLQAQGGACAICGTTTPGRNHFAIDHDHSCCPPRSGKGWSRCCGKCIRGLLCDRCNLGLGFFADSPESLRAAADYLERHKKAEVA